MDIRLALQIMMEYSIAGFGGLDIGVIYTLTINYLLPVMVSCLGPIPILMTMRCGSLFSRKHSQSKKLLNKLLNDKIRVKLKYHFSSKVFY